MISGLPCSSCIARERERQAVDESFVLSLVVSTSASVFCANALRIVLKFETLHCQRVDDKAGALGSAVSGLEPLVDIMLLHCCH